MDAGSSICLPAVDQPSIPHSKASSIRNLHRDVCGHMQDILQILRHLCFVHLRLRKLFLRGPSESSNFFLVM